MKQSFALAAVCLALGTQQLAAFVINFDQYFAGELIDDEYQVGSSSRNAAVNAILPTNIGFTVTTVNTNNGPDIAALYSGDRRAGGDPSAALNSGGAGQDTDLEFATTDPLGEGPRTQYDAGNQAATTQGNILIIQENATSTELSNGVLGVRQGTSSGGNNAPDDDATGNTNGGTITFDFNLGMKTFGFNWVDLESTENYSITFTQTDISKSATLTFSSFVTSTADFYDSSVTFGNASANTIDDITLDEINSSTNDITWSGAGADSLAYFDQVTFSLQGSGGVSQIRFTVPEPGTAVFGLLLVGLIGLNRRYRRRK